MLLAEYFRHKYAHHHRKGVIVHKPFSPEYIRISGVRVTTLKVGLMVGYVFSYVLPSPWNVAANTLSTLYWLFFLREDTKK